MTGSNGNGERIVRQPISIDRFRTLLDAYGAAAERWPEVERAAALALVAESAEARTLMDDARKLDDLLDSLPVAEPSPDLTERLLAAAPVAGPAPSARQRSSWIRRSIGALWPELPAWRPAAALAAALACGLVTGAFLPAEEIGLGQQTDLSAFVLFDFDLEVGETLL